MADRIGPAGAGIGRQLFGRGTLIVEVAHGGAQDRRVNVGGDLEGWRFDTGLFVANEIVAHRRNTTEIELPGPVAGRGIGRATVPGDWSARCDDDIGVRIDHFDDCAGCELVGGIEPDLWVAQHGNLAAIGLIAELINHDERPVADGCR